MFADENSRSRTAGEFLQKKVRQVGCDPIAMEFLEHRLFLSASGLAASTSPRSGTSVEFAATPSMTLSPNGTLSIIGTPGSDTVAIGVIPSLDGDLGPTLVQVTIDGQTDHFALAGGQTPQTDVTLIDVYLGAGNDSLTISAATGGLPSVPPVFVSGGGGDDTILANNDEPDTLRGGAGNDSIGGSDGNNLLEGGQGADTIIAGTGSNTLLGNGGNDSLDGSAGGNNLLVGGPGNDTMIGATGMTGMDTLVSLNGNDQLEPGPRDSLVGGGNL
jgi:Ca2+-binding RTX toxin-like protein